MKLIQQLSSNFDSRGDYDIDMLVLHYTGMKTAQDALTRLGDASAKVSAHYVVDKDGGIYQLVKESMRAWHAGVSSWRGANNINQRSIGIEIVNPGHEFGYREFPESQMQSVIDLCRGILSRHAIPRQNVVGHSDVAPARKEDPGELFDWQRLALAGIGFWPLIAPESGVTDAQNALNTYGYDISDLPKTITAFQRHFRPSLLNGIWDEECGCLLAALLAML